MSDHDLNKESSDDEMASGDSSTSKDDFKNAIELGDQFLGLISGVIELAQMEVLLAIRSIPRLLMLWFLMMPILLLTWCSFSGWIAWMLYAISQQPGVGLFGFFLQQLALLFVCRWLYVKYQIRMTLPFTREHIGKFMREFNNESSSPSETKK